MKQLENIIFEYEKYVLDFKFDAGTSRGILKKKETYLVKAYSKLFPQIVGYGEAGPLPKLSLDDISDFEEKLKVVCKELTQKNISLSKEKIFEIVQSHIPENLPSLRFAVETALLDLLHGGERMVFDTEFVRQRKPIPINGLIWMGDRGFMLEQIDKKLEEGYDCIKMKIGAIDFDQECELLGYIRSNYDQNTITLRVDANGAFAPSVALEKLKRLSQYDLHSIEQPIRQGQFEEMAALCADSPIPIALDEELIGIHSLVSKESLLNTIRPQYIILKPTLVGGFKSCDEWINLAESLGIGWWITSALESNIGLNAIAQYTATFDSEMPQGLGTGQLYSNNFESPLLIESGTLVYDQNTKWAI
ncbi:o-succinylbenzoate synthase [Belliella sp. R4-6]|uniref:O-succinylbenzoate synthase n=1 Tax=Belliella alkalica TaxID=1730871 RepID=A0ABS9VBX2_9BACT|nr:o-succinylbenzoate synthase [Belliella alkalica]MCH7413937.1 o-succinylbenzoate synthase [Belliella alkalica]